MTPEERRVLHAEGLTDAQRLIVLAHLDQPERNTSQLARVIGRGRSTVQRALQAATERGLLGAPPAGHPCPASGAPSPLSAPPAGHPEPAQVPRQRAGAVLVAPSEVTTPVVPTGAQQQLQLGVPGCTDAPTDPPPPAVAEPEPKAKRKGQPQSHGTGLSTPQLRAFVDDVYRAREAAGLDQRLADRTRDTAAVAAALRRGLTMAEVLAYAPGCPTLSVGAFQLEANRRATAPKGGARHAARADAAALAASQALADAWDKDAALAELNALPD